MVRISLQKVFGKQNCFRKHFRNKVFKFCLVEIPLPTLLAGNVSVEILSYNFFQIFFGSVSLSKISCFFPVRFFLGRNISSKFVWSISILLRFWVQVSLQRFFGSDFSSIFFGEEMFLWIYCLEYVFILKLFVFFLMISLRVLLVGFFLIFFGKYIF